MARIIQSGKSGAQEHLFSAPLRAGRDKLLQIHIDDAKASREHLYFFIVEQDGRRTYWVRDLGSRNGTLYNGKKLTEAVSLYDEDVLQVGETQFRIKLDPAEAPARPRRPARHETKRLPAEPVPTPSAGGGLRVFVLLITFVATAFGAKMFAATYIRELFR